MSCCAALSFDGFMSHTTGVRIEFCLAVGRCCITDTKLVAMLVLMYEQ